MKFKNIRRRRPRSGGFTLVEIMITVIIVALLAAIALPAINKVRRAAQNSRYISDLRTFAQAFETYCMRAGEWPPNARDGRVPDGMSGEFNDNAWKVAKNSVGGQWNWDGREFGGVVAISSTHVTAPDVQMAQIDAKIDDGDLTTGRFQKIDDRFCYILE